MKHSWARYRKGSPIPEAIEPLRDVNMDPSEFAKGDWIKEARAKVSAPLQGSATCCAKGTGEAGVRKILKYFFVSESLERKSRM